MKKNLFQNLLYEHKNRVFSYAFFVLRNHEDAEDVTQEVFIKLWQNIDRIDRDRSVAWIMRVAHNRCISLVRKRKTVHDHNESLDKTALENFPANAYRETDPELSCESGEIHRALFRAMERLPAITRSMLILHYYNGFKYQTIGEILDTKENTVKVEVHRGRKQLRNILTKEFPERARNS